MPSRYGIPEPKIRSSLEKEWVVKNIASDLFGNQNLIGNFSGVLSPNPFVLLCKDNKKQKFFGDKVEGFDFQYCNSSRLTQTDVGVCVATNPLQFLEDRHILLHEKKHSIRTGLKDIQHTYVLSVDKFGHLNHPPNYKVLT